MVDLRCNLTAETNRQKLRKEHRQLLPGEMQDWTLILYLIPGYMEMTGVADCTFTYSELSEQQCLPHEPKCLPGCLVVYSPTSLKFHPKPSVAFDALSTPLEPDYSKG